VPAGGLSALGVDREQSHGKEVNRPVRNYEIVFIVHPTVDGDDFTAVVDRVTELVERNSGKVAELNIWGLRRLAYPIQDEWEGQYVLMQLELEPQGVAGLERDLGLVEPVIRHLIIRAE
jgi:small subunit ribosomal protein S6